MPLSSSSVRELVVERGRKEGRKGSAVTDSRKCAGVLMPRHLSLVILLSQSQSELHEVSIMITLFQIF